MDAPGMGRAAAELALRQLSPRPPARRPPPPPPPPVPLGAWPSLLPEAVACLFALLIQATIWCSTASGLALRGHLHQAMICAGFLGSYCIATSAAYMQSRFWQRCRPVVITTLRLLLGTVPANRSSTEGLASLLRRNGTPGVRGAVHDYFRFVTGTHVFLIAVGPPLLALPPMAALVLNAGLMTLTHNPDYCGAQLLTHPLSQRRLRLAAGALDIVLQPPPSAVGAVVTKSGKPVYLSLVHLPMQQNG
ncbi:hypothetical protein COHA_009611 [Chlorella ohadii]|uniref:Uncharacterized protein n=1 Tax=Chlorella ohadii TaxID=2649997 RepID=A0AAD5DGS8_9CHLO|nr:hypothetical protein COHA_009611 [Chlorella ohadii]